MGGEFCSCLEVSDDDITITRLTNTKGCYGTLPQLRRDVNVAFRWTWLSLAHILTWPSMTERLHACFLYLDGEVNIVEYM